VSVCVGRNFLELPVSLPTNAIPNFANETTLLPAIAQDAKSGQVLMLAYMNAESFSETVKCGVAVYFSRSRQKLWRKGESSGHTQKVKQILVDCDADTILLKVEQAGVACHEGYDTCFFREVDGDEVKIVANRVLDPKEIYKK